jgi:hypothetical protein
MDGFFAGRTFFRVAHRWNCVAEEQKFDLNTVKICRNLRISRPISTNFWPDERIFCTCSRDFRAGIKEKLP